MDNKVKFSAAIAAQKAEEERLASNPAFGAVKEALKEGETFIRQTRRNENKAFDGSFVTEMEKGIDAVGRIIANPRSFIKERAELVEAGLAKKINALSVQHLASHSQFVRSIDAKGNVTPEKILTIHSEMDAQIYENRFVMTLIRKCITFIQARYWFIKEHAETKDSDLLLVHNKVEINGVTYEVDSRIKASVPSEDAGDSAVNENLLERLTRLRERCAWYLHSPFMEEMKGAKEVASPIHMTNMIVKNPDYHAAYVLWEFLDAYDELGISYSVNETNQSFNDDYYESIYNLAAISVLTLGSHLVRDNEAAPKPKTKPIKPKVIFTLDDVTFDDGRFLYDAYPEAKKARKNPMALTPEEAREEGEALLRRLKEQRVAQKIVSARIVEEKDKRALQEARKRVKEAEKIYGDYVREKLAEEAKNKPQKVEKKVKPKKIDNSDAKAAVIAAAKADKAKKAS